MKTTNNNTTTTTDKSKVKAPRFIFKDEKSKGTAIGTELIAEIMEAFGDARPINNCTKCYGTNYDITFEFEPTGDMTLQQFEESLVKDWNYYVLNREIPLIDNNMAKRINDSISRVVNLDYDLVVSEKSIVQINMSEINFRRTDTLEEEIEISYYDLDIDTEELALEIGAIVYRNHDSDKYTVTEEDIERLTKCGSPALSKIKTILEKFKDEKVEDARKDITRRLQDSYRREKKKTKNEVFANIKNLLPKLEEDECYAWSMVYRANSGCRGTIRDIERSSSGDRLADYDYCFYSTNDSMYPDWANVSVTEHWKIMVAKKEIFKYPYNPRGKEAGYIEIK